uniref:Uncharacterized protein n=1 Tax=Lactuca sativa TaxID=4236 RepID=A0A9R1XAE0_LACSA|nr:hypothetical protein LSAT_V11C500239530 [Lactuca sativa]
MNSYRTMGIMSLTECDIESQAPWILQIIRHIFQRLSGITMDWQGTPVSPSSYTVKQILRLEILVDTFPNDEKQNGTHGYEHLNEPLHILIEADLPPCVVDLRLRQAHEFIQELLKAIT